MDIIMYTIADDPMKVHKAVSLTPGSPLYGTKLSGTMRDIIDILSPQMEITGSHPGYNYMYIPDFQRFYYLDDPIITVTGLTVYHGTCDVLMSWEAGIRALPGIAARTEDPDLQDWYLPDRQQPIRSYQHVCTIKGSTLDWCSDFILFTAG